MKTLILTAMELLVGSAVPRLERRAVATLAGDPLGLWRS